MTYTSEDIFEIKEIKNIIMDYKKQIEKYEKIWNTLNIFMQYIIENNDNKKSYTAKQIINRYNFNSILVLTAYANDINYDDNTKYTLAVYNKVIIKYDSPKNYYKYLYDAKIISYKLCNRLNDIDYNENDYYFIIEMYTNDMLYCLILS